MSSQLERNKANVKAFYDLMFNQCQPRAAIERYAIFRLDAFGKVVEHWDALQVIPESSANDNGMF